VVGVRFAGFQGERPNGQKIRCAKKSEMTFWQSIERAVRIKNAIIYINWGLKYEGRSYTLPLAAGAGRWPLRPKTEGRWFVEHMLIEYLDILNRNPTKQGFTKRIEYREHPGGILARRTLDIKD
jgi:hypothetical protein